MTGDICARDIHKSFSAHSVLRGVDLAIPSGSFTAVLGPSGSGKTTLLRLIAGLERADRGTIAIGETLVDGGTVYVPAERRRVGYVSQDGTLFPHLSVAGNVGFGLPRRERHGPRVEELLSVVGLSGLGRRYPHQLSGGQQQRVALARALAVRPQAVLLDEPFASLDAQLRSSVRGDVKKILSDAGTTAVLVTHDQDEALSLADLVAVIREGKIAQLAEPAELYSNPLDAELARFVGAANLIEGQMEGGRVETLLGRLDATRSMVTTKERCAVTVLVRPEQLVLAAAGSLTPAPDRVNGRVLATSYHGHDCLVRVQIEGHRGAAGGAEVVLVRTLGDPHLADGAVVTMQIRGPVLTWPRAPRSDGSPI